MKTSSFALAASILACLIFLAGNFLVQQSLRGARADFTGNGLYTLADGTRSTLETLSEPVEITFVYSRRAGQDYPAIRAYAVRVREMLEAYRSVAGRDIILRELDPAPFSSEEDEALAAGLTKVETSNGDPLYLGVIGRNSIDDELTLPFLAPEREATLEYDLTRLIARLDRPEPPKVGILTTLQGMQGDGVDGGYTVLREIARSFEITQIPKDFVALPDDLDVLFIIHPPALSDHQAWEIDQYILRHGRALILVDPAAKTSQGGGMFNTSDRMIRSDLGVFSAAWGVTLSQDAIADTESALAIQADASEGRAGVVRHPLFLSPGRSLMSQVNLITADLGRTINLGAPGALVFDEANPVRREALIWTGPAPSTIPAERAVRDLSASDALALYEPGDQRATLAARISGPLVSAFPEGEPVVDYPDDPVLAEIARAEAEKALPHVATSETDAEIIILSDADMVDDGLYVNLDTGVAFADNGTFILNALDVLSGGADLLSLRARAPSLRPMKRVEKMRDDAQSRFFDEQAMLEQRLSESQLRLDELQTRAAAGREFGAGGESELSDEELAELAALRQDIVTTREALRQIERDFRRDIDGLETSLRALTILLGPALLALLALFVWWRRRGRAPS